MRLTGLLQALEALPGFQKLGDSLITASAEQRCASVPDAAKPMIIAGLKKRLQVSTMVVVPRPEDAQELWDQLRLWLGEDYPLYLYPEQDALPYERLATDISPGYQRLKALAALLGFSTVSDRAAEKPVPPLVIASVQAACQKIPPPARFSSVVRTLTPGDRIGISQILQRATWAGYKREPAVEVPGSISQRGGIIDIYPPHMEFPVRIEFFGDVIESLRLFDPASQRSISQVQSVTITPASEALLPESQKEREDAVASINLSGCSPSSRVQLEEELERLRLGQSFDGMEFYSHLFPSASLLAYLPPEGLLILDEPPAVQSAMEQWDTRAQELKRQRLNAGELPPDFPAPHLSWRELSSLLEEKARCLRLESWGVSEEQEGGRFPFYLSPSYGGRLRNLAKDVKEALTQGVPVVITSLQALRLVEVLSEVEVYAKPQSEVLALPTPGSIALVQGTLAEGWRLRGERELWLLTDAEIFGFTKQRRLTRRRPVRREAFISELTPGDYVVHIDHGIGRFSGVVRLTQQDATREYLALEYAEGDKLYVPADQIDRVAPYIGAGEARPALSRLNTQEWAKTKERVKESAVKLAKELLELYAARQVAQGFSFGPDTAWQQELEASFPYVETPDQLTTIQDVKEDMEKSKPMDRLVCGDVGYGKTEVAIRAAFKVVMEGMQVAVLVPTTVLAQQHYQTFRERMAAFPTRIEVLSRFRSEKEQEQVVQGLANGSIDICIGTHRLLQKDVTFKNLGMVIIDEEQRFGVLHKERLKQMRREVDVLTLSATPIPRTLYMSLTGVRDMSTMETPPEERLPINTYVSEFSDQVVREAILREMERGGQVFFVHNRVHNIQFIAEKVRRIVPEAEVIIAHGQMPEEQLEKTMLEFARGEGDVLVCTTIIEAGLDIPNVNTLIVNDADKFGLSQLYQLRGRIGRGSARAYAYLFFQPSKPLTPTAEKRLRTILSATELGAGFRIALRDLEIRGAGNILGSEQSGHISAVGFDLYCRLLAEVVEDLKAQSVIPLGQEGTFVGAKHASPLSGSLLERSKEPSPVIDIPLPAHIPDDYVADIAARLHLYQRLVKMKEPEDLKEWLAELQDRFGEPPVEVENLAYLVKLKFLAARAGVAAVAREGNEIAVRFKERVPSVRLPDLLRKHWDALKIGHSVVRINTEAMGGGWREVLTGLLEAAQLALPAPSTGEG